MLKACRLLAQKRLTVVPPAVDRQARQRRDDARQVHALLALREGAAHDDILDQLGIEVGHALGRRAHRDRGQIIGAHRA